MNDLIVERAKLLGSLLAFTRVFYKLRTGREFKVPQPPGRESHVISICRELTKVFRMETNRLIINVPPGHGKSEIMIHFIAWAMAHFPDCNFLYISYSHELAAKHTYTIKQIMSMPQYKALFGVEIKHDSSAKDNFQTTAGGCVKAFGSQGAITGMDAGLPGLDRFSGCVIMDDMHKPDEAHSDTIRENVKSNYRETISQRPRSANVPLVFIGQRLHEDDLPANLISGMDGHEWRKLILKAIDEAGNALNPDIVPKANLLIMQNKMPYVFAAQHQQDPMPAGGGIFQKDDFVILPEEPEIIATFITADTAETEKTYNDASVFSFWGIYEVKDHGEGLDIYALHWLNCVELRVEPKDLVNEFEQFFASCLRHPIKPRRAAIEKKSTGVSLISALKEKQGLKIVDIERGRTSKTDRFLDVQPYVASRLISLPYGAKHTFPCIEHCRKITANNSHRFDDMCFVAGTKIATLFGYKNIEDIKVNDLVITPFGLRPVINCGITGYAQVINKLELSGTCGHPVYTTREFKRLDTITDDDIISSLNLRDLLRWRYLKSLYSIMFDIDLQGRDDIILAGTMIIEKENMLKDCMLQFMNFIADKKFLKAMWFITRMAITLITTLLTWNVFQGSNILKSMLKKEKVGRPQKRSWRIWKKLEKRQSYGIEAKQVERGTEKIGKNRSIKYFMTRNSFARFVARNLLQKNKPNAVSNVEQNSTEEILENLPLNVLSAQQNLPQKNNIQLTEIEKHVQKNAQASNQPIVAVYNLTVDIDHVYYANNILVSNCDTMADAIDLALIRKLIPLEHNRTRAAKTPVALVLSANYQQTKLLRGKSHASHR